MRGRDVVACGVAEIPKGGRTLVKLDGISIGIFDVHGGLVAVRNVCPHASAPVCLGQVRGTTMPGPPGRLHWGRDGEILACPWHGWEFDLLTGKALADKRRHLRRYPVRVEGDSIIVTL